MKTKKLFSLILSVALIATTVLSTSVMAQAAAIDYTYDADNAILTITGTGAIENFNENNLATRPWNNCSASTQKLIISEGITSVGDYAFSRFADLQEVVIPNTVTTLGKAAFAANDSLKEITIPDSVTTVKEYAFGYAYDMTIDNDFVAHCSPQSAAQAFCIKNYVPCDSPMVDGKGAGVVKVGGQVLYWSFVAPADGQLTFNSVGTIDEETQQLKEKDTYGLVYDAAKYTYSDTYKIMKSTAIATNDDGGSGVNFKIVCNVEAGKRYYLAAKFSINTRYEGSDSFEDGVIHVESSFVCTTHTGDKPVITNNVDATCTKAGSYVETINCKYCGTQISQETVTVDPLGHSFTNYVYNNDALCGVNGTETAKCDRCDAINTREKANSALEHSYTSVVTPPTCTNAGYTTYTCIRCPDEYTVEGAPALGHNFVVTAFINDIATVACDRDGCTETKTVAFADYYNTETADESAVLDINNDGFINAKDYAKLTNDQKARDRA